jgi:opacity protein-like surface antigen
VRKTLGLLAAVVALGVVARAQLPGENPQAAPKFPRTEVFGGYSYGLTDLFNSGRRVGLNGWNASLALNVAPFLGFVAEGSGYYGTSKIPRAVPTPFPICGGQPSLCPGGAGDTFNVNTKLYNYLFGLQIPYRKWDRLTPFGEALFGHSGFRGEARDVNGSIVARVGTGLGLVGGAGADYLISPRLAVRFKGEYLQTRGLKLKQDNVRFSVGILLRSVRKKKRTLEDDTAPGP